MEPPSVNHRPVALDQSPPSADEELHRRLEELEARYRESQDALLHYRELFEFAPDAYVITDLAGIIEDCNYAATRLFRCPKPLLQGKPLPFYACREDRPAFYDRLVRLRHTGDSGREWEVCLEPKAGMTAAVALTAAAYVDAEGRPAGLRWLIRDIGLRRAVEDALRAEKTFAEDLIDAAQAVVLLTDAQGRLLRTNAYLQAVTGYDRERLLGAAWLDRLVHPAHRAEALALFEQAARDGARARATFPLLTREGGVRVMAWGAQPVRDARGLPMGALVVGHDITELQEAQRKAVQLERLAAIGQTAAGLAHESRNALQRGHACLERLHWKLKGQPEALALVERAQKAQEDLLRLYESVRDFAAPIRVNPAPCDPAEVWREVWAELRDQAPGRDAALEEDLPPDGEGTCRADRFRLAQVFRNLLENALAACPDPVRVRIICRPAEPRPGQPAARAPALRIAVRDNGPGLTEEQRRRLFETFYTTKPKGTGLGLAIVKRIVEAHGGEVSAGTPPTGAEIAFTLPRSTP